MRSSVTALFVFICALFCPLQCNGWQYGPMYSYPCDLTNGLAWGHYSNGLTNYIWPAQDINNKFSIIPSSNTYRSAHNVTFTIASTYGMTLKGFMLQAFDKHDKRVGTWALASPSGVQPSTAALSVSTAMCATNHSNTLVHGISLAVTGFSAVWIPPPHCCTGEVRVNVMIMQLYNIYWVWNINLHEDNSTIAPEPVQSLQIGDSWTNNDNSASATITWMPPLLAGGGANTTVKVSAYIMTVYLGNTKVQTITINGTHAIASEVTGFVSGTINGLLAYTNYTVSVAAQSIVSKQVATQNLGANVAAGVVLTGTVTNVTLLTPKVTALYISPLPPANVSITYKIVPTTNNVASQLNYTGVGSGVTATITYQLNNTVMSSLQNLGIYVRYYPVNDPGNIITYSPPTNPVAVKGIYTITIPFLLPSTEYEFGLELHTSGQGYANTDIISPGITPGCLNSCSGVGYCHPQLVMCHCPIDYLGPDCSIPVRFWDCEFSKPYDSLCITWSIQHLNVSTNGGEIYMRVRGPIDGGFFSVLFGVWLQDGMHNGEGFNIWVNPLTNETAMGAPKGQPELRPNHAQKITADGFIGYYNNDDSSSDLTWWFQVVNAANSGNQFPFYNLTAGIGQQYNASWCRGPGINGGHDVFHRGKMYISIADYWIQKVGDDPDYVVSFMPFYIITSIFVVLAAIYQFIAGASPPQSYSKGKGKSHSVSAPNNELQSLVLSVSSALHASILPSSLSQYFLLPANHLSQKIKNPVLKFITLWSIRLWDLVTFNIRRAIGEMLGLDLMLVGLYFLIVLTFLLTMIHQYNNIQYGLDAKTAYGYIIFWHMTLMFLPISKHSLILYLFRIPFERAIKYHRWISRMTIVWIAVHFATESSIYYSKIANIQLTSIAIPTLWDYISMTDTTQYGYGHLYGFISGVLALAIFVSSLTVVRRYFFTMFYLSHILLFPAFVVIAALHHFYVLYFAVPPLGLWVLDHVIRWVRILLHSSRAMNIKFWRVATSKKVRQTIRMDLAAKSMKTRPGQYAFICVPSLSFMWHPYSISTSQSSVQLRKDGELTIVDNDKLSFHILGMGGLTFSERLVNLGRKLHHHDSDAPAKLPLVLVDGPYGELSVDIEQYSNLVIVAGGIGVTAFIGLLNDLMVQHLHRSPRKVSLQHIRFIWITRDSSSFHHWCSELLDALFALPAFANVQLFETDSIQEEEYGFENGSTKDLLKDVRSSSQLLPVDEQNQRKTLETPYKESTLKALKSLDDVKTHELQRLSPPQVTHHQEQSVELTHVMFHINSAALTDEISVKRTSLKNRENDFSHDENEMKYADQEKVETELKVAAAADVGSTTSNISTRTTTELISVPPNSPPSSPRGKPSPRYPITRARPDWNTVFAEADNAFLADGTAKNNTAVLVCGPQGLVASVHEQASQRNWPLHKEFFYI